MHRAITRERAAELTAPFFAAQEPWLAENPLRHIPFCWNALECEVLPFSWVVEAWLDDLDRRGLAGGRNREVLERGRALYALSDAGEQKLRWHNCEELLLPQLEDPHPLIAAHAGKFLGTLYSDPDHYFPGQQEPMPLAGILRHIAGLPRYRQAVAGGFLDGIDSHSASPFSALSEVDEAAVKDWVLDVFADDGPEPFLPGVQAFWFYVHEAFADDPAFILRLIEAGHIWEAMMCATELRTVVPGMRPVLERLAGDCNPDVAQPAKDWLTAHYMN